MTYRLFAFILGTALALTISACAQNVKTDKMARDELDALMNSVLPFAQKMLSEHREFYPYGEALTTKGEVISIGSSDGDEHPPSQKLIDMMTESFQAKARSGEYRATAIVVDVKVTDPSTGKKADAISIRLDHRDDMSLVVFLPYEIDSKGKVTYGELFAQKGDSKIFTRKVGN